MDVLIYKVRITAEAVFDYEEDLGGNMQFVTPFGTTVKNDIKQQSEEFIQNTKRLHHKPYFRVPYIDEISGERLLLYFRQKERNAIMQTVELTGISRACDWDEELEECGLIRTWLNTKTDLTDIPDNDWVEQERERQAENEREQKLDEEERKRHEQRFG